MTDPHFSALHERGLLFFSGADARAFLHSQLTCDVNALPPDTATPGAYCTPKGRALATFLLWSVAGGFFMQLPRALCEPVRKRLSMYILRSKVTATDVTGAHAQHGVGGGAAATLVERVLGTVPSGLREVASSDGGMAVKLWAERYLMVIPRERETAAGELLAAAARREPESWWDGLDIAAGIASVLPDTQEKFVPQMLNLDALGGVSFSKGCYPGQEIVARMHYLGRLKERMVRARVRAGTPPRAGDKVYGADLGAQAAGMVVNVAPAGDRVFDLLAVVQLSSVAAGPVRLVAPDGPELAIGQLPYTLPTK